RRVSWRVTAACVIAVIVLCVAVAVLMSPLLYAVIMIALDIVNLVTPTPDLLKQLSSLVGPEIESGNIPIRERAILSAIAAIPALLRMASASYGLSRVWATSPLFNAGDVPGRTPDRTVLSEERLSNVVEEMAIAAGVPVPRVMIVPGGVNAAACGRDA